VEIGAVSVLARRVVAKCIIFTERTFLMNAHVFAIVVFTEARSEGQVQEAFEATTPSCKQEKPDEKSVC
jgi:NADH:ubiquinone oxidoreductase subunit K